MRLPPLVACVMLACGPSRSVGSTSEDVTTSGDVSGTTTSGGLSSSSTAPTSTITTSGDDSTSTGEPRHPDSEFFPLDWSATTAVTGTTPFGTFAGTHARFTWGSCNGEYPYVYVVEDPQAIADRVEGHVKIARAVTFALPGDASWDDALTGTFTPWVFAFDGGEPVDHEFGQGEVVVTMSVSIPDTFAPVGMPHIVGELSIHSKDETWDLSGTFDAAYCGPLPGLPANCE